MTNTEKLLEEYQSSRFDVAMSEEDLIRNSLIFLLGDVDKATQLAAEYASLGAMYYMSAKQAIVNMRTAVTDIQSFIQDFPTHVTELSASIASTATAVLNPVTASAGLASYHALKSTVNNLALMLSMYHASFEANVLMPAVSFRIELDPALLGIGYTLDGLTDSINVLRDALNAIPI